MDALKVAKGIASVTIVSDAADVSNSSASDAESDVDYTLPTIPIRTLDDAAAPTIPLETSPPPPIVTIRRNSHCPKVIEDFTETGKSILYGFLLKRCDSPA